MKIGILTQPLYNNYGGIIQNFALQTVLKRMGHEVWTINRSFIDTTSQYIKMKAIVKRSIIKIVDHDIKIRLWTTDKEKKIIHGNLLKFIDDNITITDRVSNEKQFQKLQYKYKFDAYVVGSDQVWRPKFSNNIYDDFLCFLNEDYIGKRLAYAASFGVDQWEFTTDQTIHCASLAKRFDAISVREDTAVSLCKRHLNVEATHVLDPTMLITKDDYIRLVDKDHVPKSKGTLMTNILDQSMDIDQIIQKVSKGLNLIPFSVMTNAKFAEVSKKQFNDCIYPPVTEWIRGFMDADYVVTDSFHGTVFSIIFNKPFVTIGNHDRGMTRFTSLLKMFGLEERLIASSEELTAKLINTPIDFCRINQIREREQHRTMEFLYKALNN